MAHYHPHSAPQPGEQFPGGGWHPTQAIPPQPPRRGRRWLSYGLTAFIALVVGVGIGSSGDEPNASAPPQPTVTVTEEVESESAKAIESEEPVSEPKEETGPATTIPGDGQYLVGEDIKPGTYKTAGSAGSHPCYWARLQDASGELGSIIANDNIKGQTRVALKKGEYFETNRCQEWQRVG